MDQHVQESGLDVSENKWDLVFDFTDTNDQGEKLTNYKILDISEFQVISKMVDGLDEEPVQAIPIPMKYGGTGKDNDPNENKLEGQTFDIRTTTAADAEKIYEEQERRRQAAAQQQQEDQFQDAPQPEINAAPADEVFDLDDAQNFGGFEASENTFPNTSEFENVPSASDFNAHSGFDFESGFGQSNPPPPEPLDKFIQNDQPLQITPVVKTKPVVGGEFTDEEIQLLEAAQRDQDERLRQIRLKEDAELQLKREKQQSARLELETWYSTKQSEVDFKRKNNKEEEWAFLNAREEHKKSKNVWEHIIDNVEIDPRKYEGHRDITRMRQAMLARRNDLKKAK